VHALDAEYLLLVQQLNINQRSAESKRVMVRHPECEQAVLFIVPQVKAVPAPAPPHISPHLPYISLYLPCISQVKVVPGPPAVRERLQANRAYISLYLPIPPYTSIYLPYISPTAPPHLQANRAYISLYLPISPYTSIYLPYISPISPLYLPYICRRTAPSSWRATRRCATSPAGWRAWPRCSTQR